MRNVSLAVLSLAGMLGVLSSCAANAQTVINYPGGGFGRQPSMSWLQNAFTYVGPSSMVTAVEMHSVNSVWFKTAVNKQAFSTTSPAAQSGAELTSGAALTNPISVFVSLFDPAQEYSWEGYIAEWVNINGTSVSGVGRTRSVSTEVK